MAAVTKTAKVPIKAAINTTNLGQRLSEVLLRIETKYSNILFKKVPAGRYGVYGKNKVYLESLSSRIAWELAEEIRNTTKQRHWPSCVTVIVDKKTGNVFIGSSGGIKSIEELSIEVRNKLPKKQMENFKVQNCSEVHAYDQAIRSGSKAEDLEMFSVKINKKTDLFPPIEPWDRCFHCDATTSDIKNVGSDNINPRSIELKKIRGEQFNFNNE